MTQFGEIPGYPPGSLFADRAELRLAGLHAPPQAGISGSWDSGADSIVLSGGYEDDLDLGDVIIYTGQGGNDRESGKQLGSQTLIRGNRALARSCQDGIPVRVIRGQKLKSEYSPEVGYQYGGLFRVDSYWKADGRSGFEVWRFRLEKIEFSAEAPSISQRYELGSDRFIREESPEYLAEQIEGAVRREATIQRIIRNTRVAQQVKELHRYRCQVCGVLIETVAGRYAECAHIRPLGAPHDGPDSLSNVLCLCPNHHVAFDFGGIYLLDDFSIIENLTERPLGKLRRVSKHPIDLDCIRYHRSLFERPNAVSEID